MLHPTNFKKEVLESKTPVLVDFYADWCGPCRMLGPILEELEKDKDFEGKLHFAKINTEEYGSIAEEYAVQSIPCMIIFKNGQEAARIVGFAPKAVMKAKIQSELAHI